MSPEEYQRRREQIAGFVAQNLTSFPMLQSIVRDLTAGAVLDAKELKDDRDLAVEPPTRMDFAIEAVIHGLEVLVQVEMVELLRSGNSLLDRLCCELHEVTDTHTDRLEMAHIISRLLAQKFSVDTPPEAA